MKINYSKHICRAHALSFEFLTALKETHLKIKKLYSMSRLKQKISSVELLLRHITNILNTFLPAFDTTLFVVSVSKGATSIIF